MPVRLFYVSEFARHMEVAVHVGAGQVILPGATTISGCSLATRGAGPLGHPERSCTVDDYAYETSVTDSPSEEEPLI